MIETWQNERADLKGRSVLLALSGGVDSAVAALRLQRLGLRVHAVYMQLWTVPEAAGRAAGERARAEALAAQLGIPLTVLDLSDYFYAQVVSPFLAAYAAGQTPNPCVVCNQLLKFRLPELTELSGAGDFDYYATGHYARVTESADGLFHLLTARDPKKDQSYMLYHLQQADLARLLLPLGDSSKTEIREEAARAGLASAKTGDSQDICFLAGADHHTFLRQSQVGSTAGDFVSETGQVLGRHQGLGHYTVGQSKRLGIALGERMVVARILPEKNQIVLVPLRDFKQKRAQVKALSWTQPVPPAVGTVVEVCVRYRGQRCPVRLLPVEGLERENFLAAESLDVYNEQGLPALSPGQAAVFYHNDEVLGGGIWTENFS